MRIKKTGSKKAKKTVGKKFGGKKLGEDITLEALNNEVLKLKEEVAFLTDKDKFLKDEIARKEALLKKIDEEAPAELVDKKAELEDELKDLQATIVQSLEAKEKLESEIKVLKEEYEENFKLTKNQISNAETKVESRKSDLNNELEQMKNAVDNAEKKANDIIEQANKEKNSIETEKTIALAEKNAAVKNVQDCEAKISELEVIINQESAKATKLTAQNNEVQDEIKSYEEQLAYLKKEVSKTAEELKVAQAELEKVEVRIGFIQKKEESLKSFENYIIDTSNKYGLEYQPYEG